MTTYTTIPDTDIDQDSPVTQPLMTALRDNPIAIAEGSAGAPSIETAAFGSTYYTAGGIGTYVWATRTNGSTDVTFGSTLAGTSLSPTSAVYGVAGPGQASVTSYNFDTASALSGTWRAMGEYDHEKQSGTDGSGNFINLRGATLWLRIS